MIKMLSEPRRRRNFNLIKGSTKMCMANVIHLIMNTFPLRLRMKQGCHPSLLIFYFLLHILANVIRQEKEIKVRKIGKEETKLSLFIDGTIFLSGKFKRMYREIICRLMNERV